MTAPPAISHAIIATPQSRMCREGLGGYGARSYATTYSSADLCYLLQSLLPWELPRLGVREISGSVIGTRRLLRRRDTPKREPRAVIGFTSALHRARIAARVTERVRPGIKADEALHFLFELSHQA
jgi:hypothetical protein